MTKAQPKPKAEAKSEPAAPDTSAPRPTVLHGIAIFGETDPTAAPDPVQARVDAAVAEHNEGVRKRLEAARAATNAKANQREDDPVQAAMDAAVAIHARQVAQANAAAAAALDTDRLAALESSMIEIARREAQAAIAAAFPDLAKGGEG